jgi:SAM-dependent methyltransferase
MDAAAARSRLHPTPDEAFESYATMVAANREQVERVRELVPASSNDFWADRAPSFRPGGFDAEETAALEALAQPDDVWLDIGAGGGRFALPLSRLVSRVIAVEPSAAMRDVLRAAFASEQRTNYEVLNLRWPPPPRAGEGVPTADVSLVANVLYDAVELREFLEATERHSRRLCVVICSDRAPSTPDAGVWEALYGEPLCALPGLPEFLAVLGVLGRRFDVRTFAVRPPEPMDIDRALEDVRWRFWVSEGSEREARLRELLVERFGMASGLVQLPPRRNYSAVVSWEPPR